MNTTGEKVTTITLTEQDYLTLKKITIESEQALFEYINNGITEKLRKVHPCFVHDIEMYNDIKSIYHEEVRREVLRSYLEVVVILKYIIAKHRNNDIESLNDAKTINLVMNNKCRIKKLHKEARHLSF